MTRVCFQDVRERIIDDNTNVQRRKRLTELFVLSIVRFAGGVEDLNVVAFHYPRYGRHINNNTEYGIQPLRNDQG